LKIYLYKPLLLVETTFEEPDASRLAGWGLRWCGGWGVGLKRQECSRVMADGTTGATKCADTDPSVEKETEAKMCRQILPTLGKFKYPEVVKQPNQFGGGLKSSLTERRVGTGVGHRRYGSVAGWRHGWPPYFVAEAEIQKRHAVMYRLQDWHRARHI